MGHGVKEAGYIEKGTGKHQSNSVYDVGGCAYLDNEHSEESTHDYRYGLCDEISYCIDANYSKGITVEKFFSKHLRQLVIERVIKDE